MAGRFRPTVAFALAIGGAVALVAIWRLQNPDHIVTVATGFALASIALGKDIVQADKAGGDD